MTYLTPTVGRAVSQKESVRQVRKEEREAARSAENGYLNMTDALPHYGVFVTYEDLTDKRVHVADVNAILVRLNIEGVLKMIAFLNAFVADSRGDDDERRGLQDFLVSQFFDEQLKDALKQSIYSRDLKVGVFHHQQQLLMMRLALTACSTNDGLPWGEEARLLFGRACLMVNDLAGPRDEELEKNPSLIQMATQMLAIGELPSDSQPAGLVGRAYDIWLQFPNEPKFLKEDNYVPIAIRFEEYYKISLEHFIQGYFLLLTQTEGFNPSEGKGLASLIFNSHTYLDNVAFPQAKFQTVLEILSCKLELLQDKVFLEAVQNARFDFSLLRRYPLIEVESGIYLCHDVSFFRKFATDGIYWRIHEAVEPNEQEKFRSFFGKLIALYVEKIMSHVYEHGPNSPKHLVKNRLAFTNGKGEVCDIFVQCGDAWVIIETKASLLSTRAKYLGDASVLEQELQGKFVSTRRPGKSGGANKGVGQLANSIKMLTDGMLTNAPELRIQDCKKIYPVIISYDAALISPGIPQYFERQLLDQIVSKEEDNEENKALPAKPRVMPLTILSMDDFEILTTIKNSHEISTVLATYHYFRAGAETLGGFVARYPYYKIDVTSSRFYESFLALKNSLMPYFS